MRPELAASYSVADNASVTDVVAGLSFNDRIALTSVNGNMVSPQSRADHILTEGDVLLLLPPIKGG